MTNRSLKRWGAREGDKGRETDGAEHTNLWEAGAIKSPMTEVFIWRTQEGGVGGRVGLDGAVAGRPAAEAIGSQCLNALSCNLLFPSS